MICDVCGRENAEHLKFCADCGKKFSVAAPVPGPVMPAGAAAPAASPAPTPSSGTSRVSSPSLDSSSGRRSHRPEAPTFNFAPTPIEKEGHCPTCGNVNPPAFRFCAVCGTTIPNAKPVASKAPTPIEEAKLVPGQVLSISDVQEAKPEIVTCARCRGQCTKGARFCKYCGAALPSDGASPSAAPARVEPSFPPPRETPGELRAVPLPAPPAPIPQPIDPPRVVTASPTFVARKPDEAPAPPIAQPAPVPAPQPPPAPAPQPPPVAHVASVPAPAADQHVLGKLVVLVEDGSEGKTYELSDKQVDIGRADGDILLFDDAYVSPRHARLIHGEGGWVVRDLGSVNGVYARIRGRYALQDGDLILLGLQVLQFQAVPESEQKVGFAVQHGTRVFGSKPVTRLARLVQRTTEGLGGDVYHLFRDETVVGREVGDIVFTHDPFLSRKHASVRFDAASVTATKRSGFVLEDLGSSNGTYIAIRNDHPLQHGDRIRVGQHLFRLDVPGEAANQTKGSDR